ncbi:ARM repeat-containing protein [Hypoxylon trugodes]|uniref:ARM repeat-containing protein n=1 Tax=Hypoxylon trugodes TaxID=326681 RepID=UPI002195D22C|nr:ARM repeat-containing protein [Hypoxylon trugodes]KAI1388055.1 ARM repeat-containing protein [Hypoxylon trugodes]
MTPDKIQDVFDNIPQNEESRVEILKEVLDLAQKLQEAKSPELKAFVEKVGNASREGRWRIPLGRSGLLNFFLDLTQAADADPDIVAHALRVIGNSCADQDENRQRVIDSDHLPGLVKLLSNESLLQLAIPVLYNICVDYEPTQATAAKAGLSNYLIDLFINPQWQEKVSVYISIVYKLIGIAATQDSELDSLNLQAPYVLLTQAGLKDPNPNSPDLDGFTGLSSAALTYLSRQQFQDSFLETPNAIKVFLEAFQTAAEGSSIFDFEDAEEKSQLNQLELAYTGALADLSAHPRFVSLCPLDGDLTDTLLRWISSGHSTSLQAAACLALGNIARSDDSSVALVQQKSVHKPLIAAISSDQPVDAQLAHSIFSFLKNLSIPASNKAILGDAGLLDSNVLPRIWNVDTQPQIQFDAVSLTRLLLVNCPENVRRVSTSVNAKDKTHLHGLMELHRKADQDPIKMEISRSVANVCRVLHSEKTPGSLLLQDSSTSLSPSEQETRSQLQEFYKNHPALPDILLYLGLQTKFSVLRSELWFVLALMARSVEGAAVVTHSLQQRPEIVNVLIETITGEKTSEHQALPSSDDNELAEVSSGPDLSAISGLGQLEPQQVDPAKAATMTKVDRENGLVLIAELLKRCPDELPSSVRNTFNRILKIGGELILDNKD